MVRQVQSDPRAVLKLRCVFLKLRSGLEMPLLRVAQVRFLGDGTPLFGCREHRRNTTVACLRLRQSCLLCYSAHALVTRPTASWRAACGTMFVGPQGQCQAMAAARTDLRYDKACNPLTSGCFIV